MMKEKLCFILSGLFRVVFRPDRIAQISRNLFLDIKYAGVYLGIPLSNGSEIQGFTNTTSSEYYVLEDLFSTINISGDDVIVDIGCGRGRVLGWLASRYPQNKIIGIEIDPEVAANTKKRMRKNRKIEVVTGNALDKNTISECTLFYLFHPFHEQPMREFAALLKEQANLSGSDEQRPLIVYHNCCYLHVFEEDPTWKVERLGVMNGLPTAIIYLCSEKTKES